MSRVVSAVVAFLVGDDVWGAVGVVATIAAAAGAADLGLNPWWLLPVAVPMSVGWSLRRATSPDRA